MAILQTCTLTGRSREIDRFAQARGRTARGARLASEHAVFSPPHKGSVARSETRVTRLP